MIRRWLVFDPLRSMTVRPAICACALLFAGCHGTLPSGGTTLIPDSSIKVSPKYTLTTERLIYYAGAAALAYYVIDPLEPNWSIEEARFPENRYYLSLKMKRYYTGGAGEARQAFQRRAKELVREGGFEGFTVVEYSEGLDSNAIGSQRVAEGVVAMVGAGKPKSTAVN